MTTRIEKVNKAKEKIRGTCGASISEKRYWDIEAMENVVKQDEDTLLRVQVLYNSLRDLEAEGFRLDYCTNCRYCTDLGSIVERDTCTVHISPEMSQYAIEHIAVEVSDPDDAEQKQREEWDRCSPVKKVVHTQVYFEDVAAKNVKFLAYLQEEISE